MRTLAQLKNYSHLCNPIDTVRLVQLVEHQIVVLGVVGSSPTSHPKRSASCRPFSVSGGMPGSKPGTVWKREAEGGLGSTKKSIAKPPAPQLLCCQALVIVKFFYIECKVFLHA